MSEFKGIPITAAPTARAQRRKIHDRPRALPPSRTASSNRDAAGAAAAQARGAQAPAGCARRCASGAGFAGRQAHRARASPEHGVRGGQVPEHRRVLERRHGDHHVDGRGVHARLPLLRGGHGQSARLAGCRGAGERRALGRVDGPQVCGAHLGQPRRPAGRRRRALRSGHSRHQARAIPAHGGRGADAGFPGRPARCAHRARFRAWMCSRRMSRPSSA